HPAALLSPDHTIFAAYASQRTQAPLKPLLLVFSGSLLPRLSVLSRELLDQLLRAQVTDGRDLLRLGLAQAFIHLTNTRQLLLRSDRIRIILSRSCLCSVSICGIATTGLPI